MQNKYPVRALLYVFLRKTLRVLGLVKQNQYPVRGECFMNVVSKMYRTHELLKKSTMQYKILRIKFYDMLSSWIRYAQPSPRLRWALTTNGIFCFVTKTLHLKLVLAALFVGHVFSAFAVQKNGLQCDDAVALHYCEQNPNTYIALLYPCVYWDLARTKAIFCKYGILRYEKKFILRNHGPFNILHLSYAREPWIGNYKNNFKALHNGRTYRFLNFDHNKSYEVLALLFECDCLQKVLACKKEIRSYHKDKPYPIHINDTHQETVELAQIVFHDKSIEACNNRKRAAFKKFDGYLAEYKKILASKGVAMQNFCIVGSAVKAAQGICECNDLFFIHHGHDGVAQQSYAQGAIRSLNSTPMYRDEKERKDIIFNPAQHFYYKDVKFAVG